MNSRMIAKNRLVSATSARYLSLFLAGVISLSVFSSCVVPPKPTSANVLENDELQLVSSIKRGQEYALSGRSDLAEVEFRKALALDDALDTTYNDLGYVLQAQDRLQEARRMYRKALLLNPDNIAARENLAKALYQSGEIESAIQQYKKIALHYSPPPITPNSPADIVPLPQSPEARQIAKVYRNLAIAYYSLGEFDDAICYSALALDRASDLYETGRHVRLLFSLDLIEPALSAIRLAVVAREGNVDASRMLDYAIALFVNGDSGLAKTALNRVFSAKSASYSERLAARLLLLSLALREDNKREGNFLFSTLVEDEPEFCDEREFPRQDFWPTRLIEEFDWLESKMAELCENEV